MNSNPQSFLLLRGRVDSGVRRSSSGKLVLSPSDRGRPVSSAALVSIFESSSPTRQKNPIAQELTAKSPAAQRTTDDSSPLRYRSDVNLKWKSNQFDQQPQTGSGAATSSLTPPRHLAALSSPQTQKNVTPLAEGSGDGAVYWRACRTEALVRREAIFYNFLLSKARPESTASASESGIHSSAAIAMSPAAAHSDMSPLAKIATLLGCDDDETNVSGSDMGETGPSLAPHFDQPSSLSLLWDISRVAATSHLLGGDGNFFLRKEFMVEDGNSGVLPPQSDSLRIDRGSAGSPGRSLRGASAFVDDASSNRSTDADATAASGYISVDHVLKLFGNERTFNAVPGITSPTSSLLHRATSYLLTEKYKCTLGDYLRTHSSGFDAVQVVGWCKTLARQFAELHRAGVLHNNIHVDAVALADVDSSLAAKVSWFHCATITDLQAIRGLRKQTLSQNRADPQLHEFHVLQTSYVHEPIVQLAKTFPAVLPPEWFSSNASRSTAGIIPAVQAPEQPTNLSREASSAGLSTSPEKSLRLRSQVTPSEKSDAYLFGKMLQHMFTETLVEFNPQSVPSVTAYYLAQPQGHQALFSACPSHMGKIEGIDKINSETLRHLITAATLEDVDSRWSMHSIALHPFFWDSITIVEFFECIAEFSLPPLAAGAEAQLQRTRGTNDGPVSLRVAFKEASQRGQVQSTKKSNITAPELASMRGISKQLSTWAVEPRVWITSEVNQWIDALTVEGRQSGNVRCTVYENLVHQQLTFILDVYRYLRDHRCIPAICGQSGDAESFLQNCVNRYFPTLLMECVAMVMNEEDAPKFARFLASRLRLAMVSGSRASKVSRTSQISALKCIYHVCETISNEKGKSIMATGYDHIVQHQGALPQFPVHIPESEKLQLIKKSTVKSVKSNKPTNMSRLPKWAQEQIAAADI